MLQLIWASTATRRKSVEYLSEYLYLVDVSLFCALEDHFPRCVLDVRRLPLCDGKTRCCANGSLGLIAYSSVPIWGQKDLSRSN
eukprot:6433678-Amphidinium_carterae.1